jgi:hypothetical protein
MTDELSDDDLAAIERRWAAATPGPWWASIEGRDHTSGDTFIRTGTDTTRGPDIYVSHESQSAPASDLDFIAGAKQDVPRLLQEIRRLRATIE